MLFKDYHIPLIRAGEKTVTRRIWKERQVRPVPGSIHMAASASMVPDHYDHNSPMLLRKEDCTCFIRIDDDYGREADREPLGAMTDADAQKEGDYETVAEFRESWVGIHGEWDPDVLVDPVPFSYYGREPSARPVVCCRECGEEIEEGLVCSDCEDRVDDLILGFAALNRNQDTDR